MSSAEAVRPSKTTLAMGAVTFVLGTGLTLGTWLFGGFALGIFGICSGSSLGGGLDDAYYFARWLSPLGGIGLAYLVMRWHHRRHMLPAESRARRFGRRSPFQRN